MGGNSNLALAIGMPELLSMLSAELNDLPDERKPSNNTRYTVKEAIKSAFSVFFMQSRSFLDHQRLMRTQKGRDNAASLFGIGCAQNLLVMSPAPRLRRRSHRS